MHRIALPHHHVPRRLHRRNVPPQQRLDPLLAVARDQRHLAHLPGRRHHVQQRHELVRLHAGPDLDPDGVLQPAKILDVRARQLARAVADPQKVRRRVVPAGARRRVPGVVGRRRRPARRRRVAQAPRQALLVLQQQPLVARVQVHRLQLPGRVGAHRLHEAQRVRDGRHDALVLRLDGRRLHVAQVPVERVVQVRDARRQLRAHVVERRGRVEIGAGRERGSAGARRPYLTSRDGSGVRSDGSKPLMLSPRNEGISLPSTTSVGLDRGLPSQPRPRSSPWAAHLANCPAMRAMRTTGLFAPGGQRGKAVGTSHTPDQHQAHLQQQLDLGVDGVLDVSRGAARHGGPRTSSQ